LQRAQRQVEHLLETEQTLDQRIRIDEWVGFSSGRTPRQHTPMGRARANSRHHTYFFGRTGP
ncbi:hypothetical protein, partial [Cupriavidus sp. amp6]|uniref:hypothetical protein n=1 Tax=Cupriavidus sp. amp6 TaxID=388051 RepID=UPI00055B5787